MAALSFDIADCYRGALIGVLVGDTYGDPYEFRNFNPDNLADEISSRSNQASESSLNYTDDTEMTISTLKSLLAHEGLNPQHLAQLYTEDYFEDTCRIRNYGGHVGRVFSLLRKNNYQDPYGPAATQFGGLGSLGNGAAMRSIGIALFSNSRRLTEEQTLDLVRDCSRITHSHVHGINGAIIMVYATQYLLKLEGNKLDVDSFLDFLIVKTNLIERNEHVFLQKLHQINRVFEGLQSGKSFDRDTLVKTLGNEVTAHESVPLAIFAFLWGVSEFNDSFQLYNEFTKTLHWAISCGGDTDTIASMACGLSGVYLGMNKITDYLYKKCESWELVLSLADQLA